MRYWNSVRISFRWVGQIIGWGSVMEFGSDIIFIGVNWRVMFPVLMSSGVFLCLVSLVLLSPPLLLISSSIQKSFSALFPLIYSLPVFVSILLCVFFPSLIEGSHFHRIHPHSYAIARICGVLLACTCGLRRLRRSTTSGLEPTSRYVGGCGCSWLPEISCSPVSLFPFCSSCCQWCQFWARLTSRLMFLSSLHAQFLPSLSPE